MKIIANHAHLMPSSKVDSWWPEGDASMLLEHLDYCGIEKVVIFPPFACQMDDDILKSNKWAWNEVKKHSDRFIAAGILAPTGEKALELLDIFKKEGVKTAKVHPSIDKHDVADPKLDEVYAKAAELGITLDYHTGVHGTPLSMSKPEKFDDIAWRHPKLKLIFEHLGGRTYFEQFLAILVNHRQTDDAGLPLAYGGLTSVLSTENTDNLFWYLGPEKVMDVIRFTSANQLIYGLDFPWNSKEVNKKDIETILSLEISNKEKEKILGGNLIGLIEKKI
jgi:predicted TIM-barrel fold metal-dependent hydrolase